MSVLAFLIASTLTAAVEDTMNFAGLVLLAFRPTV
jgi:hypothetical protein